MKQKLILALIKLKEKKEIDTSLSINDIWFISEYEDYYYFRLPQTDNYDDSGWKVNKTTGKVEFQNWMNYAFKEYKDGKSIGQLATILLNEP